MSHINRIIRHKMKDQSQFRVHFYLHNLYYDHHQTLSVFLENVAHKVSKLAQVSHVQATTTPRKFVDISIGLQSDLSACSLIQSGKKVMLIGEDNELVEHEIIMGQGFRSYYRAWKEGRLQRRKSNKADPREQKSSSSSNDKEQQYQQRKHDRDYNSSRHFYEDGSRQKDSPKTNCIWIFCIPLEIKDRQIYGLLTEKKLHVKGSDWKLKQDMEYLQIQLYQSISHREIQCLDLRIDKYPLLVLPKLLDSNNIAQHILKHEMEINFEKDVDEYKLIRLVDKIGGALAFIKDEYYGHYKYVIALNCWSKLQRLGQQLQRSFNKVICSKPRYPLRLCRLQKNFTFSQIVQNISYIENQY